MKAFRTVSMVFLIRRKGDVYSRDRLGCFFFCGGYVTI